MYGKVLISENTYYFKKGQIVEGNIENNGILVEKHFVPKDSFIILSEALSMQDEEKVKVIVKTILKRMFWRLYTRSAFITS